MLETFKNLKKFQLAEYISLALLAFILPISWQIATYVMAVLFVAAFLKGIFEEGFKANKLQYKNKVVFFLFIAFWLIHAISFLYSENSSEASFQIGKKLSFLLFPLFFMISNLSYLNKERGRTIMYCFVMGILSLFLVNIIWAAYDVIFGNAGTSRLYEPYLLMDGTGYIHHTYTSIYSCMAISFCFYELFTERNLRLKIFNIFTIIMMILFIALSTSRAGMLCIGMTFIFLWIWLTFIKKERKTGLILCIIIIAITTVGFSFLENGISRITETFSNIKNVERQDRRVGIMIGYMDLLKEKFWFGVGAGDRSDETMKSYLNKKEEIIQSVRPADNIYTENFDKDRREYLDGIMNIFVEYLDDHIFEYAQETAAKYNCDYNSARENIATYINVNIAINENNNAHNQYVDTTLAVGIIGLIILLSLFAMPVYLWIKTKKFDIVFFSLIFITFFNCLFESIFERQMGIMFFTFLYFLLFHISFCQNDEGKDIKA